jgi:preprotein translocase subunit SecA
MLRNLFGKLGGDSNGREISRLRGIVTQIGELEAAFEALTDEALRAKTDAFRRRISDGETLDALMVEAFAAVREAGKRTIGMRHFDVQLIGGVILHQGRIAEMRTGEGKTLVATLPLYLSALSGEGAHLITPNDYLSKVGVQWMGPIYYSLGLSVGVIQSAAADPDRGSFLFDPTYSSADDRYLSLRPVSRQEAYEADITYGTNNEFGFDFLRDNMARDLSARVQRGLAYAIIDEVDNILIDEARTPLIISGPAEESSELYQRFAGLVPALRASSPASVESEEPDGDYVVDERTRVVTLTERGVRNVEAGVPEIGIEESIYDPKHAHMLAYLDNALRAHVMYRRDKDYIVKDGEVIIVDEFTGRLMYGRRFSEGLHQAIEAKEGVPVRRETLTYATVTFQNYFRMYAKLAGMTGTAKTEEEEFRSIYDLDVVVLPTNVEYRAQHGDLSAASRPVEQLQGMTFAGVLGEMDNTEVTLYESPDGNGRTYYRRLDLEDLIYPTESGKFRAVVDEIRAIHEAGRPVLVGTIAIETSEKLSRMLAHAGVPHQVLNAKYHMREAEIIAQAGRPGTVTIATNMAGRGVDIKLGGDPEGIARQRLRKKGQDLSEISQDEWNRVLEALRKRNEHPASSQDEWADELAQAVADCETDREKVLLLGGLHILGTERHDARRIDNQLRGRSGRQGDPGSSRFYLSLGDELMRRFGGERVKTLMDRLGVDDGTPLQHSWLDKSIGAAQMRVEGYNFDIRKHVLEFDDVVNKQREVIYAQRRQVLSASDLRDQVLRMVDQEVSRVLAVHLPGPDPEDWDLQALFQDLRSFLPLPPDWSGRRWRGMTWGEIETQLRGVAEQGYDQVNRVFGHQAYRRAAQEGVTVASLQHDADSARRLVYQRVIAQCGDEHADGVLAMPIRDLPRDLGTMAESVFDDVYRLYRDRHLMLSAVDGLWVRHLTDLAGLREGIGLRAYGQQNPLVAYRKEAHEMYDDLLARIEQAVARTVYLVPRAVPTRAVRRRQGLLGSASRTAQPRKAAPTSARELPGRNDPCWCGSGKKYKHCHMHEDRKVKSGALPTDRR